MFIPSGLAYRNVSQSIIEKNSPLIFEIALKNVNLIDHDLDGIDSKFEDLNGDNNFTNDDTDEDGIDDLKDGEWLVNITYKGNKKPEPTYFKITKFYNWGKPTESKVVSVYKFQNEREKIQLMYFNKELLVVKN